MAKRHSFDFPRQACAQSLAARFEQIAREGPGRLALRHGARSVMYDELNRQSNRLAHALLGHLTGQDAERLHQLITRHAHYTNSARARTILEHWAEHLPKFKKVMPVEYRHALMEIARQQAADPTGLEVIEIGLRADKA